jgi:hypothetical protein
VHILKEYAFLSREEALRRGIVTSKSLEFQGNPREVCLLFVEDDRRGERYTHIIAARDARAVVRDFKRSTDGWDEELVSPDGEHVRKAHHDPWGPFPLVLPPCSYPSLKRGWPDEWSPSE